MAYGDDSPDDPIAAAVKIRQQRKTGIRGPGQTAPRGVAAPGSMGVPGEVVGVTVAAGLACRWSGWKHYRIPAFFRRNSRCCRAKTAIVPICSSRYSHRRQNDRSAGWVDKALDRPRR